MVVDLDDGYQFGGRPGQEDLLGQVELCARDVPLDDRVSEIACELDDRLAIDPVEDRRSVSRGDDLAVANEIDVLSRSLADEAAVVEQDRLVVAGVGALGLGEDRVEVLAGGLGVRDQTRGRDAPPGGDLGADALLLALLAEVGAPGPDRDDHLDGSAVRIQTHLAVAAEGKRADIAPARPVAADQLLGRLADLLEVVLQGQVVELGRLREPVQVVLVAEDRRADLRVVAADSLEDAGAVVQPVREDVHVRLVPGDELAVLPDELSLLHESKSMNDGLVLPQPTARLWAAAALLARPGGSRGQMPLEASIRHQPDQGDRDVDSQAGPAIGERQGDPEAVQKRGELALDV